LSNRSGGLYAANHINPDQKFMKTAVCFLAGAGLVALAVGLKTDKITPVPSGMNGSLQTAYSIKRIPFSAVHHQQAGMPRIRLWESTSGNWSGYAVPLEGSGVSDTFSAVQGTWVVPTVTGSGRQEAYSSAWVGLDGYESATVEQIGTEQDWTGRAQANYVWFEMYPAGAYEIENFPANPGDSISAQVQYAGQVNVQIGRGRTEQESVFKLTIVNNTHNVSFTVPSSYTTVATAARASAEWVVEAPTSRTILPLADFGSVTFSRCEAVSTGSGGVAKAISFWPNDPLTMVDPSGGGSVPSGLSSGGTGFSVAWAAQ
jgi:hypothetical protein